METEMELGIKSQSPDIRHSISWERDELYTGGQLINAYFTGKPNGMDNIKKMYMDTIDKQFQINTKAADDLLAYLKEVGVKVYELFLRFNDIGDFEMLVLVDEKDFKDNDLIDKSYWKSGEIMESVNVPHFNLDISFVEKTKYFDRKSVICDGYGIIYAGKY